MTSRSDDGLRAVGDDLGEILTRLGLPAELDMTTLVRDWQEIAGEPFASRSRPSGFHDGELHLGVVDGATATLLRFRAGELVERLEERYGKGRVRSVKISVERGGNSP